MKIDSYSYFLPVDKAHKLILYQLRNKIDMETSPVNVADVKFRKIAAIFHGISWEINSQWNTNTFSQKAEVPIMFCVTVSLPHGLLFRMGKPCDLLFETLPMSKVILVHVFTSVPLKGACLSFTAVN